MVNQTLKVAPELIKAATNDINNIEKESINQIISQTGKEVERVLPKILSRAIEDIYQTSFRLLGNFRKQQSNKIKRKILFKILDIAINCIYNNQTIDHMLYKKNHFINYTLKKSMGNVFHKNYL